MIHLINHIRCVARMEMKCTHKKGMGLGAAVMPPVDPGQSPGWGLGGKAARYSYDLFRRLLSENFCYMFQCVCAMHYL